MKRTNKNKLSSFVFYLLLILIVLLTVSNYLTSGLLAKYLSSGTGLDNANVAKWEITYVNGVMLDSGVSTTHLENGSSGEWGLDIANLSEVTAKLSSDSTVKLRLYSPNFNIDHEHDTWDFLVDKEHNHIDNPINFKVYLYNCSLSTLEDENIIVDGVFNSSAASTNNVIEHLVLDTATQDLRFTMVIDNGILYYETNLNIGELSDDFNMASGSGTASLRVVWKVNDANNALDVKDEFTSYHLVKVAEYNTSNYLGIVNKANLNLISLDSTTLTSDAINTYLNDNCFTIEGIKYVIGYKMHDYFDYLIYSSSLGGEVMITLEDVDGTYIKRCTKLSLEELAILNERSINDATTLDGLSKFIEKLEYNSYQEFLTAKSLHEQATGYISLGLECRIMFNLKVDQVD